MSYVIAVAALVVILAVARRPGRLPRRGRHLGGRHGGLQTRWSEVSFTVVYPAATVELAGGYAVTLLVAEGRYVSVTDEGVFTEVLPELRTVTVPLASRTVDDADELLWMMREEGPCSIVMQATPSIEGLRISEAVITSTEHQVTLSWGPSEEL